MAPNTDIATRAVVVALKSPYIGKTTVEISKITSLSIQKINQIYARAIERGFNPELPHLIIRDEWLRDAPRSGRPTKQTPSIQDQILTKVRHDQYRQEKTCADIDQELSNSDTGVNISPMTVWRILRKAGMKKTKPTQKPGLTKKMRIVSSVMSSTSRLNSRRLEEGYMVR